MNNTRGNSRRRFIRNNGLLAAGVMVTPKLVSSQLNSVSSKVGKDYSAGKIENYLSPGRYAAIDGHIGRKLTLSYQNRILAENYEDLIEPFRNRTETRLWQSEFWGKWLTSAILAYRYQPTAELKAVLDKALEGLISTQTSDGYIGNYAPASRLEQWDIWGMKYCMMGLLEYYALFHNKQALTACTKLADYLMGELNKQNKSIVQTGNYRGMASSSVLGVICQLYTVTGQKKYLDFAKAIVDEWESPQGPQLISKSKVNVSERFPKPKQWYSPEQGSKAYEMMSCYEGLLDLYRLTGSDIYKTAAENTWENILNTEMNIAGSGASAECWFGGGAMQTERIMHYQETCVSVTWIRLSLNLFLLTGEAKYADEIEKAYYNSLLGSMYPEGYTWAKYTPLTGQRLHGSGQCGMELNCCVANGPRGLFALPAVVATPSADGVSVNFYTGGKFKVTSPAGQEVDLIFDTEYPVSGKINITINMPKSEKMMIRFRIPAWSKTNNLVLNGEDINEIEAGTFVQLDRNWKSGDTIALNLDMRGRVIFHGDKNKFAAIMTGPVVLAQDARFVKDQIINTIQPVMDKDNYINLTRVDKKDDNVWMKYTANFLPESFTENGPEPIAVTLVDYSSAGYADGSPTYRVWFPHLYDPKIYS